jgi:thiamine pyrophosphate-dependent acetolactate synthase large subunit-like protein
MKTDLLTAPASGQTRMEWGSDAIAEALASLDLRFIALTPGASYRGLHDSIVNHLGNANPALVLCLHEEHAVAVAHGYAKVTERPMGVALHSNVGLMHAVMAVFNAYCDRVPVVMLGATGPLDAAERRPWVEWIHTAGDQGALIRSFCKWDDQPGSAQAAVDALVRADLVARTYPCGPTYVCLDARLQEAPLEGPIALPDVERHRPPASSAPTPDALARAVELIAAAERPLVLLGRVGRGQDAWDARVALAERLGAVVLTDLKQAASFPTAHPLHPVAPAIFLGPAGRELLRGADLVLSLDWVDLGGTLRQAYGEDRVAAQIVSCTLDHTLHNGWSKDHFGLAPVDLGIPAHPDTLVQALLERLGPGAPPGRPGWPAQAALSATPASPGHPAAPRTPPAASPASAASPARQAASPAANGAAPAGADGMPIAALAGALRRALGGRDACLARLPIGWDGAALELSGPLDYLGHDGGGGVGSGPGMAVGAALALAGSDRLAVAVLGDGDFLMGASALWTAAHYRLPLLVVVANNRSFFNDEVHQERMARARSRPVENRWVGQHIRDPDPDLAQLAASLGLTGHGPVTDPAQLATTLSQAVEQAANGAAVVVDVRVSSEGYPGAGVAPAQATQPAGCPPPG